MDQKLIEAIAGYARQHKVPLDALLAVVEIESAGDKEAIPGTGLPVIRWEGHYFYRLTDKKDMARRQGLAHPRAGAVKNPRTQKRRYEILEAAAAIDEYAAYGSISIGIGQVMGSHYDTLGFASPKAMFDHAKGGVEKQLDLMIRYIVRFGLMDEVRRLDWSGFARGYNGPAYAKHGYHTRLERAYRRWSRQPKDPPSSGLLRIGSRGRDVRELQTLLRRAGSYNAAIDGDFGPKTKEAVMDFQGEMGLQIDGIAGPKTMAKLTRFKVTPDDADEPESPLASDEGKVAVSTGAGGASLTAAAEQLDHAAHGVPSTLSIVLNTGAAILIVASIGLGLYAWWRSRSTNEGTS